MDLEPILLEMKNQKNMANLAGMKRFGINTEKAFGIGMPVLRNLARKYKKQHELAAQLWNSGYHEARILATLIDDPKKVTEDQMELWVQDFDSWDICDGCCLNLFGKTPFAFNKAKEWANRNEEFVKRAGFVMMATLAVHDKKASNEVFEAFFPLIISESKDERNFVKKAVNWALRQIGKRNQQLHPLAIDVAEKVKDLPYKSSKWIASDALRELKNDKIISSINKKLSIP